jgi:hypothetical protein
MMTDGVTAQGELNIRTTHPAVGLTVEEYLQGDDGG